MRTVLKKIDCGVRWGEDLACVATLAMIVCIVTASVIARYVFRAGFLWADELIQALMVGMGMFGCARAIRVDGHTELTSLLNKPRSRKVKIALRALISAISLLVLVALFAASVSHTASAGDLKSVVLRVPRMYYYVSIPIGFGLSIYEFTKRLRDRVMNDPPENY